MSVIVVAHDVREEVLACLASVNAHSDGLQVQTVLVDNGSTDGTTEAVRKRFPEVAVVRREKNEGLVARNHGLRLASGRHRMFLDSDATLTEGALGRLVAFLDADPSVGLVGPRLVYGDGSFQPSARRFPPPLLPLLRRPPLRPIFEGRATVQRHLMADANLDREREVEYVLGACQAFRAGAQALAGEMDPAIFYGPDDADWCLRIRQGGLKVMYVPDAVVVHGYRRSSSGRPISRLALRHLLAYAHFQRKWRHDRRRLIEEGREMDRRAAEAGGSGAHESAPSSTVA